MMDDSESHEAATTRAELVDRLARALYGTGAYGETLDAIARETRIAPELLREHFGDRMTLLLALLEWHDTRGMPEGYDGIVSTLGKYDAMSPEELVTALMGTARRHVATPGYVRLTALLRAESNALRHPARDVLRQRQAIFRGIIARAIEAQRATFGDLGDPLSPADRASTLIATWEGLLVYGDLNPGEIDVLWTLELTLRSALGLPIPERNEQADPEPSSPDGGWTDP